MKKWLVTLLVLLLSVAMVLSLASCGDTADKDDETPSSSASDDEKDEDKDKEEDEDKEEEKKDPAELVIGEWEGEIDFSGMMEEAMGMMDSTGEMDFDLDLPAVELTLELDKDGGMVMEFDEDSLKEMMGVYVEEVLVVALEAQGLEMTVDEYMEAAGISIDDLIESSIESNPSLSQLKNECLYEIDGDKFYSFMEDEERDEKAYIVFSVTEDELVWEKASEEADAEESAVAMLQEMFPITFERVG